MQTEIIRDSIEASENGAWFTFKPRPNRPELFDEQSAFIDAMDEGVSFCIGGNGSGTSVAGACKISNLVLFKKPPPRHDTPFWIVGPDYDQTIESFWKEKLYGMGFIDETEIDWARVTWHDLRRELPKTVPLRPWVNHDPRFNWVIEFRSFEQGRTAMQAREIGGFCLTEQFPWSILVEILRGMRRHDSPGAKFCEFTPVDPYLSRPLQDMVETDTLPPGWRIYRCNTRCNVDDPNSEVDVGWYNEFFSMVGDETRATRETGAWPTFEGLIYKTFNPAVHLFPNDRIPTDTPWPSTALHKRCIDWGTGPHNAFCLLWMAIDSNQRVYVYDEYYTTEPNTHEERLREAHKKDGWNLRVDDPGPPTSYKLVPAQASVRPRWRYDQSIYQQTYGPPDDPGMFRESAKYCLPVAHMSLGPYSYHPSIEAIQGMLRYTPEEYISGVAPKLFIHKRCKNLIRELSQLRWQQPPTRGVNPKDAKAYEVEKDNHAPSALRGGIWSHLQGAGGGIEAHRIEQRSRPQVRHKRIHRR